MLRRALPTLLATLIAVPLSAAAPAAASEPGSLAARCVAFAARTPSVEVDLDGDRNPEVRVPSISDVYVCAQDDVTLTADPVTLERCDFYPTCWAAHIHVYGKVTADTGLSVCRSVDNQPLCSYVDVGAVTAETPWINPICVGADLNGGYPCSGWYLTFG